ncbi:MAG TPA: ABC transporter substrate-binding protein [Alphaproteobacteria bacterium]
MVKFGTAACVALVASAIAADRPALAQQKEEVTFAMPAITFAFVPAYIAQDLGFWTKQGLEVKLPVITGIGAMNAVLSRSAEFSISSIPTIIRAQARGQKVVAIAGAFEGTAVELVLRKDLANAAGLTHLAPLDRRAAALKGRTVAILAPNTIVHAYLRYFARRGGIDPERDFKLSIMSQPASIAALQTRDVDAMAQVLPYSTIAIHNGSAVLLSSGPQGDLPELLPFQLNGIMARPDYCEQKPRVCTAMVAGYGQGVRFLHERTSEAKAILRKRIPNMDQAPFDEAFELTRRWTPPEMRINEKGIANAQELMLVGGMMKPEEKLSSFKAIYTNKFVGRGSGS